MSVPGVATGMLCLCLHGRWCVLKFDLYLGKLDYEVYLTKNSCICISTTTHAARVLCFSINL